MAHERAARFFEDHDRRELADQERRLADAERDRAQVERRQAQSDP